MHRRAFLSTTIKSAAAVSALGFPNIVTGASKHPNVLFIAIDDLNDWIGCMGGHPDTRTPNLDRLAARGTLFNHAYCTAPACNPSRASLFTGLRPSTTGCYNNRQPFRRAGRPDAVTLLQHFQSAGYNVIGRGKMFHGRYPDPVSWHEYIAKGGDPAPPNRPVNGIPDTRHFDWGPVDVPDEEMDDHKVVSWCTERLARKDDKPQFLACGLFRPHLPWFVPRKYFDMFPPESITLPNVNENDLDDIPEIGRRMAGPDGNHANVIKTGNWRKAVSGYLASIAFADACIGRLLDAFENGPYADDTVVMLWGDHGWHLGEKLHWRKFALWEEATKAPLMISAPGVTSPNAVCNRTVDFADIYPTLIDLCGLPARDGLEGQSLRPQLEDPSAPRERPALTTHGRGNHSVRSERWRYIRYNDGTEELYDHDHDDLEWTNLAGQSLYADVIADHRKWLPSVDAPDGPRDNS